MRNKFNKQQGGTVLGIVIGLVIGLGIALAVAVAITKTPMPFTTKIAKPEKTGAAAANQGGDPNKSLYGNKAAAKDAAKQFVKEEGDTPPNQVTEKKPQPKPESKVAAVDLSGSAKPNKADGKISDAKEAAAKTDSAEDQWSYFLQAGAFREKTDAENTRARLALLGVEARVSERQSENGTLYRVRVGPFAQLDSMNRVRGKLTDNGVDAAVVRISK